MSERIRESNALWSATIRLAAELAQRNFDNNLLRAAAAYAAAYPQGDLLAWTERLAQMGQLFSSSEQTSSYRHELWAACHRLQPRPGSATEWAWVLGWAARLFPYFQQNRPRARRISDITDLYLPEAPPLYQPPVPESQASEDDNLPPMPDEASQEAENLFAQMQALWARPDKKAKE